MRPRLSIFGHLEKSPSALVDFMAFAFFNVFQAVRGFFVDFPSKNNPFCFLTWLLFLFGHVHFAQPGLLRKNIEFLGVSDFAQLTPTDPN